MPGDSGCWEVDTVLVPALGKSNRTGFVETAVPTAGGCRIPEVGGLVVSVFRVTLIWGDGFASQARVFAESVFRCYAPCAL